MPDILSLAELADIRRTVRDLTMPGTAILLRGTVTPNGIGGHTQTWGTVTVGGTAFIPCRYQPSSATEQAIASRVTAATSWTVVLPALWDVRITDRLYIEGDGRLMAVQGVLAPRTWEMQRRVICTEER
jgi:hypothetical protein